MADTASDFSLTRFQSAEAKLHLLVAQRQRGTDVREIEVAYYDFNAAAVGLMMDGLRQWLAAAAQDRESAERDRASALQDRESAKADRQADRIAAKEDKSKQDSDRAAMNGFTKAIMFAAIVSAVATGLSAIALIWGIAKEPKPIVIPAPIVAPAPAPIVNVPSVPVTLSPTINVTLPRSSRSPK
jgi:hypothetical protein